MGADKTAVLTEAPGLTPPPPAVRPADVDDDPVVPPERLARDPAMLRRIAHLDPFPPVVHRLLAVLGDPGADLGEVERLLATDGALTAQVLRMAASSHYGRRPPANLHAALIRIGTSEVRRLVVTASTSTTFDDVGAELWRYSLRCALIARGVAAAARVPTAGDPFLCGLLHDIGVTLMYRLHGARYASIHREPGHDDLSERELDLFGHTHGDVGSVLVSRWRLMTALDYVVQFHHDVVWSAGLDLQPRLRDLLASVVLARYLSIGSPTHDEQAAREIVRLRLGLRDAALAAVVRRADDELAELGALLAG